MDPYLRSALRALDEVTAGLSAEVIGRPVPGRWSIAQILEHLTLAYRGNAEAMRKALASGELRARPPSTAQTLIRIIVVEVGYFPRVKAPERTVPTGSIPVAASLSSARAALEDLDATVARASARFGQGARLANHPYLGGMTAGQWCKFHWRHTRLHARQIRARAS